MERFGLDRSDFQPFYEDRSDCISVTVPDVSDRRGNSRALGFIKYEKVAGRVIIANSCAQLQTEHLELGHSSKGENANLAGSHGEGLKLAALVMSRNGYSVNINASNNHWNFILQGSRLRCALQQSAAGDTSDQSDPGCDMAHLRSYVDRDVTVMIEAGGGKQGKDISLAVFQDWLRGSLEIRGFSYPTHILETNAGDLILDPQFQGHVYLKGMLLPATICKLQPYKLGYNFPRGRVNRDRQMLVDSQEEADIVRQIWEAAFESHEKALLPIYINLLRNFPEAPDVGFADRLQRSTKALIWKHLLREADGKGFYYSETSNAQVC